MSYKNVKVAPFQDEYADDFKRLNLEWIEKYFVVEEMDKKQLEDPQENIIEPGGEIYSVLEDGKVRGVCALVFHEEGVYEIAKMAVDKESRGKGYGNLLMEAVIEDARKKEANKILIVSNTRLEAAINLYKKYGFIITRLGQDPDYERGNIEMQLDPTEPIKPE
ncbi:MAG: GNAT family N-acetyltransferase [Candidatus Marinimicrobia bacterium]|nr:GNAT family N-acetyltransferase [Candidatus Neomarinimicrobiota bacterium]